MQTDGHIHITSLVLQYVAVNFADTGSRDFARTGGEAGNVRCARREAEKGPVVAPRRASSEGELESLPWHHDNVFEDDIEPE